MSGPNAADWAVFLKWPSQRSADLVILNRAHGVLVGMGVKLRGPLMHTDHGHGPGLLNTSICINSISWITVKMAFNKRGRKIVLENWHFSGETHDSISL